MVSLDYERLVSSPVSSWAASDTKQSIEPTCAITKRIIKMSTPKSGSAAGRFQSAIAETEPRAQRAIANEPKHSETPIVILLFREKDSSKALFLAEFLYSQKAEIATNTRKTIPKTQTITSILSKAVN